MDICGQRTAVAVPGSCRLNHGQGPVNRDIHLNVAELKMAGFSSCLPMQIMQDIGQFSLQAYLERRSEHKRKSKLISF